MAVIVWVSTLFVNIGFKGPNISEYTFCLVFLNPLQPFVHAGLRGIVVYIDILPIPYP